MNASELKVGDKIGIIYNADYSLNLIGEVKAVGKVKITVLADGKEYAFKASNGRSWGESSSRFGYCGPQLDTVERAEMGNIPKLDRVRYRKAYMRVEDAIKGRQSSGLSVGYMEAAAEILENGRVEK